MDAGTTNSIYGIWGAAPDNVFAVGDNGTILHYNGTAWSTMDFPHTGDLDMITFTDIWGASESFVVAVSNDDNGTLMYDGSQWKVMPHLDNDTSHLRGPYFTRISGTGANKVYARCSHAIWNGSTWYNEYDEYPPSDVCSGFVSEFPIWASGPSNIYTGQGHQVRRAGEDNLFEGTSWDWELVYEAPQWVTDIWGLDANNIYVVGGRGLIAHKTGTGWVVEHHHPESTVTVYKIHGTAPDNLFAVGEMGVLHYDGNEWQSMELPAFPWGTLFDIWVASEEEAFAVGSGSTILHYLKTYSVSTTVEPAGAGTITRSPSEDEKDEFAKGDPVTLTAAHKFGYRFVRWSGDGITEDNETQNSLSITISGNHRITAHFEGTTTARVPQGRINRGYQVGFRAGDPVDTGSLAYIYDMPLLDLGGPAGLALGLHYRSDLINVMDRVPNDFPARDLSTRFWWSPRCYAKIEADYRTFWLENGAMVAFKKEGEQWQLHETGTEDQPSNGQPIRYVMKETGGYIYLMSPVAERVYLFEKSASATGNGRIRRILDRKGNALIFTYAAADHNNPATIQDGLGRTLTFTYAVPEGGEESLTTVSGPQGRQIRFTYEKASDNGNAWSLRSVTDAGGNTTRLDYETITYGSATFYDNITQVTRPAGNIPYKQTYGACNFDGVTSVCVSKQIDAAGNTTHFDYNQDPYRVTENRGDGTTVTHDYPGRYSLPKTYTDPAGNTFSITKNGREQVTAVSDRNGNATAFTYHDASGRPASVTNAEDETLSFTYAGRDQTFTNPYNSETVVFTFYDLTRIDYPDETHEQFAYDGAGNLLTWTDRAAKTWTYTTNARGQVLTATNPTGGVATFTYHADGTLATLTDSDTGVTTYAYDAYKRPTTLTHPDGTTIQIAYDDNDRITAVTDENNRKYTYEYDANGNLTKITDPADKTISYAYTAKDRGKTVTDRLGRTWLWNYDDMGRPSTFITPDFKWLVFRYDNHGRLKEVTLGGDDKWQIAYGKEGTPASVKTPLDHTAAQETDKHGYVNKTTDPLNHAVTLTRDAVHRITGVTDPLNRTVTYAYDTRGLLTGVGLPHVGTAAYQRDDAGRLTRITDLGGNAWSFTYTDMGRLKTGSDPLGNTRQWSYNAAGQVDRYGLPGGAEAVPTYDNAGNLTRMEYSDGTVLAYGYDALNRLTTANGVSLTRDAEGQITATGGTAFGAGYDAGGNLSTVTYNHGAFTVTYTYDFPGMLSRIRDDLTGTQIDFVYDKDLRLTQIKRSNGVNTTLTWDDAHRLTRLRDGDIIDHRQTLDAAGQIIATTLTAPLDPAAGLAAETAAFTYDAASRIDTAGYGYDARGRLTAAPERTFAWDDASRLTSAGTVTLTYDGLGGLSTRTGGGGTTTFYHNYAIGGAPIVAEKTDGAFRRFYVRTPGGGLLYTIDAADGNTVYFYHFDLTGSTLALTDSAGTVTDAYAYSPYGALLGHEGDSDQPFTFAGRWGVRREPGGGEIYQMGVRYYDAETGRFLSREPVWPQIGDPVMLNPYSYARLAPSAAADATGLAPVFLNDLWTWDEHKRWEAQKPGKPSPARSGRKSGAGSEKRYVFFGVGDTGPMHEGVWRYDPAAHAGRNAPPQPLGRSSVALPDGGIRVFHPLLGGIYRQGHGSASPWSMSGGGVRRFRSGMVRQIRTWTRSMSDVGAQNGDAVQPFGAGRNRYARSVADGKIPPLVARHAGNNEAVQKMLERMAGIRGSKGPVGTEDTQGDRPDPQMATGRIRRFAAHGEAQTAEMYYEARKANLANWIFPFFR